MADAGSTRVDEAARLEAALERIARRRAGVQAGEAASGTDTVELARRLDQLIAELRAVLGGDPAER